MSNNEIKVSISEDQLAKLVEQVVLKKLEEYLSKTYVIENSVRTVVSDYLNANDIGSKIKEIIADLATSQDTVLSRVLEKHVETWAKANSGLFTSLAKSSITSLLTTQHVYSTIVEPLITKTITEDAYFLPHLRSEINNRLSAKIKNVTQAIGDGVSPSVIKEFLKQYTTQRFDSNGSDTK